MGIFNRMGMELSSEFSGTLVIQSWLFELLQGVLGINTSTDTQEDRVNSSSFSVYKFTEVCMLLLSRVQLMLWPSVLTELYFYEMHMTHVDMKFMWLPYAACSGCPPCGPVQSAM